jgi:hypothetical protein
MALAIRFLLKAGNTLSGRTYFSTGLAVDIPFPDADAIRPDQAMKLMVIGETQRSAGLRPRPYKLAAA